VLGLARCQVQHRRKGRLCQHHVGFRQEALQGGQLPYSCSRDGLRDVEGGASSTQLLLKLSLPADLVICESPVHCGAAAAGSVHMEQAGTPGGVA
jgi:hypothetical protein